MFCYRIQRHFPHEGFTISLVDAQRAAVKATRGFAPENDVTFSAAMTLTFELFKHIGWDGTRDGEVRCFAIPGLYSMMTGFIITDVQDRLFIASPVPLPHIERDLDWDARVSHEEIVQAKRAIQTGHIDKPKPPVVVGKGGWRMSARGNLWTDIHGCNVTVVNQGDGYCALIRKPQGEQMIRTKTFQTRQEVQSYVLRDWYDIIDPRDAIGGPVTDDETDYWEDN